MKKRSDSINGYLSVLDGLRAISLIMVYLFHSYQQSWIDLHINLPAGKVLTFNFIQRYGYVAVDAFFVISGFCLFYPIARSMFGDKKKTDWKQFYIKRAKKILPSYVLLMIIMGFMPDLSVNGNIGIIRDFKSVIHASDFSTGFRYLTQNSFFKHLFAALTFSQNRCAETYGSLVSTSWTLAIEVQFYLIFPLIAYLFRKKPVLSFAGCLVFGEAIRLLAVTHMDINNVVQGMMVFYIDVFAFGMIAAYFVVYAKNKLKNMDKLRLPMTLISILSVFLVYQYLKWMGETNIPNMDSAAIHRFMYRPMLNLFYSMFIVSACFSFRFWEKGVWGNPVAAFLSTISYNFYLWHQNIHIFFKRKPVASLFTLEDGLNHTHGPMIKYMIFTFSVSLIIAIITTYLVERPMYKYGFIGYFKNIWNKLSSPFKRVTENA